MYVRDCNRIFCSTYILSYCARETIVMCQKTPRKKGILLSLKLLYSLCPVTPQNKHNNKKNISFDRTLHQILFVFSSLFCLQNYSHRKFFFFFAYLLIFIIFPFVLTHSPWVASEFLLPAILPVDPVLHVPPYAIVSGLEIRWPCRTDLWTTWSARYERIMFATGGSKRECSL